MNEIIVFDFFAPFGHFKIPYTTTSPLTFPVPPKTSIYGILGAILGINKNEYLHFFQQNKIKIGLSIKNPIKKIYLAENLINTKNVKYFARMNSRKLPPRTQIRIEFLKDPCYRIFVESKNTSLFQQLTYLLKKHKSHYTISMGISECIANFKYIGIYEKSIFSLKDKLVKIDSIIPLKELSINGAIKITNEDLKLLRVHIPIDINPQRELIKSEDFIIETTGKPIPIKINNYIYLKGLETNIITY